MVKLNHHYQKLSEQTFFPEIDRRLEAHKVKYPKPELIDWIGNLPSLLPSLAVALSAASQEMSEKKIIQTSQGDSFLREKIAECDYPHLKISPDEIFVSDGSKSDLANIQEIFSPENRVALADPTPLVSLDTNIMAGRTRLPLKDGRYGGVIYLPCTEANDFKPEPPQSHADLIYLSSPNTLTGVAIDTPLLKKWVDYAKNHQAVIFFDGALTANITSDAPRSIYEIEGAKEVAIEFRSFSPLPCSYLVIPRQLEIQDAGKTQSLGALWKRRSETKFAGVPYPIQKAAAAFYSAQGQKEMHEKMHGDRENLIYLKQGLQDLGFSVYGGIDAPHIWWKTPKSMNSWDFFDLLLEKAGLTTLPGIGFGQMGNGFVRIASPSSRDQVEEALLRLKKMCEK
ncbi:MAG: LL-diaminopimelate aminotransferase [Chlamydiota bacterium]